MRTLSPALTLTCGHRLLGLHAPHDPVDFFLAQRRRLVADAHEASHAGRIAHHIPGFFVQDHLDQHIAGIDAALDDATLTIAQLDLFLGGHDHLEDVSLSSPWTRCDVPGSS